MTAQRITYPTGRTLLQGRPYVNAAQTNIRATFRLYHAAQRLALPAPKEKQ